MDDLFQNRHTPLQSADCGAKAPKTRANIVFALWSNQVLADQKMTNCLINKGIS